MVTCNEGLDLNQHQRWQPFGGPTPPYPSGYTAHRRNRRLAHESQNMSGKLNIVETGTIIDASGLAERLGRCYALFDRAL